MGFLLLLRLLRLALLLFPSRVGNQWVAPSHTYVYFERVDGWACTSCGALAIYRTMRALTSWCSDPPSKKGTDPPQVCVQARLPAPRLSFKPRSTMDVGVANQGQIEYHPGHEK